MTPEQRKKNKNQGLMGLVAAAAIIGVSIGGVRAYQALWGGKIGEKCEESLGCMTHGVCISHRCQKRCDANKDCDPGYHCGTTSVTVTTRHTFGEDKEDSSEKICFKDQTAASASPR